MTSPQATVPFPYRICRAGLHQVPRELRTCPQCDEVSNQRSYLKNKERQIEKSQAKRRANPEEYQKKSKEQRIRRLERNPNYYKDSYQKNRAKRLADVLAYNKANRERAIWRSMISRCTSPINKSYADYGGRGIKVCDRWTGERGYDNFLDDMGRRPSDKHSLDRTDNDGDYEPGNCAWRTYEEQAQNRRSNFNVTCNGETKCLVRWSRETGLPYNLIRDRLVLLRWTPERALSEPARSLRRK